MMAVMSTRDELLNMTPVSPTALTQVSRPGIYAWWGSVPWPSGFPEVDTTKPLYVGIAASQSLGERVSKNHLRRTRSSALRRTLTGLLLDTSSLRGHVVVTDASNPSKFGLDAAGEAALTRWMLENLRVTWVTLPAPGGEEKAIIGELLPPLNDTHAARSPYRATVAALRAAAGATGLAEGAVRPGRRGEPIDLSDVVV
ncbi:MAG: hypothetical protein K0S70_668 [Microbacterium sp.]|nr:hypothetical protein [Microbacterium sp.]